MLIIPLRVHYIIAYKVIERINKELDLLYTPC